MFMRVNFLGG